MFRILLIDDDDDVRQILERQLTDSGYQVLTAANGAEGIGYLKSEGLDLVITDIFMPEKEGIATIIEIRKSRPDIPIIAISGGATRFSSYRDLGLDSAKVLGANYTMAKPFRSREFLELVDQALTEKNKPSGEAAID